MRHLPLEKWHSDRAKMAPFAGWNMPLWYRGISDEHRAVRSHAGIFDISHMGEIFFSGDDALSFLQMVTTNDIRKPPPISGTYSLVLNERGGIKDETLVFNMGDGEYMMVCDAVAVDKLTAYFSSLKGLVETFASPDLSIRDRTSEIALFSIQGPSAEALCEDVFSLSLTDMWWFQATRVDHDGHAPIVSKSGYTGENGFEVFIDTATDGTDAVRATWDTLMDAGKRYDLFPCGIGARDTLRIEAGYTLYGNETNEHQLLSSEIDSVTPYEAGLDFALFLDKDFIGKRALELQQERGIAKRLAYATVDGKAIARTGDVVLSGGREVGTVTSGTKTPLVGRPVALALVDADAKELSVKVRGKRYHLDIVTPPFYDTEKYGAFREV